MCTRLIHRLSRFRNDPSGAVAIEFVLIAPILIVLLFGIITMGYFVGVSHSVTQLATGAARASVAGLDQTERAELANLYLSEAGARYPLLIPSAITPTVTFTGTDPQGISIQVIYEIDGSILGIANGMLGLDVDTIDGSAYLVY